MTNNNKEILEAIKAMNNKPIEVQDTKSDDVWAIALKIGMFIILGVIGFIGNNSIKTMTFIEVMSTKQDQIIKTQEENTSALKEPRFTQNNFSNQVEPIASSLIQLKTENKSLKEDNEEQNDRIQKLELEIELLKNK